MSNAYKTVKTGGTGEVVEKKSRFIAYVRPVDSEEAACLFVEQIKKKHYDARHNCYAFSVGTEQPLLRFSDDGEPQGTAGKPILEVIKGADVRNVCIVVTRYFGGALLGTGGLCRAYTDAAKAGLADCGIVTVKRVHTLCMSCDYNEFGKLQHFFGEEEIPVGNPVYAEKVTVTVPVPVEQLPYVLKQITEITKGSVVPEDKGESFWCAD